MIAIAIARDYDGLKQAALEMLEEERSSEHRQRVERQAATAANGEAMLAALGTERTLADGYYMRIGYLLELESMIHAGLHFEAKEMAMSKVRGLIAIESARAEFDRLHPRCRGCGTRLDDTLDNVCGDCRMRVK